MREIETNFEFERALAEDQIAGRVVQNLDLTQYGGALRETQVDGTLFLGCELTHPSTSDLVARGALLFPHLADLPFNPYRRQLYSPEELYEGFEELRPDSYTATLDAKIYSWWQASGAGEPTDLRVVLARRLHDLSIADAIHDLFETDTGDSSPHPSISDRPVAGLSWPRRVAIMGGHSLPRTAPGYQQIVDLAARLAERRWLLISGGGPGAMEATHLGCWLRDLPPAPVARVLRLLGSAPDYQHPEWLSRAFEARRTLLSESPPLASLSIPTWHYGHEPPNPFASHIAKHFNNSLREDGLVSLATGGIVFAPGSAGTVQEIFQDAAQNHYLVGGRICPMVFLDREYWTERLPVWPLIQALGSGKRWIQSVALVDHVEEAIAALDQLPTISTG
jgi:predicted Rossmann-fold nucleotide-binding protein